MLHYDVMRIMAPSGKEGYLHGRHAICFTLTAVIQLLVVFLNA